MTALGTILALVLALVVPILDAKVIAFTQNFTVTSGENGEIPTTNLLSLYYNDLLFWREDVERFVKQRQLKTTDHIKELVEEVSSIVETFLSLRKYPPEMISGRGGNIFPEEFLPDAISCSQGLAVLVQTAYSVAGYAQYDLKKIKGQESQASGFEAFQSQLSRI